MRASSNLMDIYPVFSLEKAWTSHCALQICFTSASCLRDIEKMLYGNVIRKSWCKMVLGTIIWLYCHKALNGRWALLM